MFATYLLGYVHTREYCWQRFYVDCNDDPTKELPIVERVERKKDSPNYYIKWKQYRMPVFMLAEEELVLTEPAIQ